MYKTDVLLPVLQSVARRLGQGEMYEGIALETDPLVMPRGASEIEVRAKQVRDVFAFLYFSFSFIKVTQNHRKSNLLFFTSFKLLSLIHVLLLCMLQLVKLFENLECHMIGELRKKMSRELTLVLAERGRSEETALPTDLWKRPVS